MNEDTLGIFTKLIEGTRPSRISPERIERAKHSLSRNGVDITVDWSQPCSNGHTQFFPVICNKCNSAKLYGVKAMLNGTFVCNGCTLDKYKAALNTVGCTFISIDDQIMQTTCNTCGSIRKVHASSLMSGNTPKCETCHVNGYKSTLDALGFTYLAKYVKQGRGTMVSMTCQKAGHLVDVSVNEMHSGHIRCKECDIIEYKLCLAKKDCTFVSLGKRLIGKTVKSRIEYKNSSGDVFEATTGNILGGKFTVSKESSWYQKHCVYLITNTVDGVTYCKIGTANEPERRLADLKLTGNTSVFTLAQFKTRFEASELEVDLHREFKESEIDASIAETFTESIRGGRNSEGKRYYRKEGITEWFNSDVFDVLSTRYKLTEQ